MISSRQSVGLSLVSRPSVWPSSLWPTVLVLESCPFLEPIHCSASFHDEHLSLSGIPLCPVLGDRPCQLNPKLGNPGLDHPCMVASLLDNRPGWSISVPCCVLAFHAKYEHSVLSASFLVGVVLFTHPLVSLMSFQAVCLPSDVYITGF